MPSNAEKQARERLANNGRNPANKNAGILTGSDLHLCEMLLAQLDRWRAALTEICVIRDVNTPSAAWRSDLQQIARKALERED